MQRFKVNSIVSVSEDVNQDFGISNRWWTVVRVLIENINR